MKGGMSPKGWQWVGCGGGDCVVVLEDGTATRDCVHLGVAVSVSNSELFHHYLLCLVLYTLSDQ